MKHRRTQVAGVREASSFTRGLEAADVETDATTLADWQGPLTRIR
jgi:hypothetical protein